MQPVGMSCNNCNKPGHKAKFCPSPDECNCCGSIAHKKAQCPHLNHVCESCGKTGHVARKCFKGRAGGKGKGKGARAAGNAGAFSFSGFEISAPHADAHNTAWVEGLGLDFAALGLESFDNQNEVDPVAVAALKYDAAALLGDVKTGAQGQSQKTQGDAAADAAWWAALWAGEVV